jgi:hypothetical protein
VNEFLGAWAHHWGWLWWLIGLLGCIFFVAWSDS